jgi:hypothetical protein
LVKKLLDGECYKPGMFTLFPSPATAAWFAQNGWWLVLAAMVIAAATLKALRDGTTCDASNLSDFSDGGGDSCSSD